MNKPRKQESYEHIQNLVNEFAYETFGPNFSFRDGNPSQFDICVDIIYRFVANEFESKKRKYILQAPTGSGKSVIAIIVAGVLSQMYGMRGYILVSDISLLEQYVTAVNEFCPDWGTIKGRNRYTCIVNGRKYDHGECRIKTSSFDANSISSDICPLCDVCPYLCAQEKATGADVVVCTYYWWLIHKNMLRPQILNYWENEFVICDECHNICGIVQDMYSLNVGKEFGEHFAVIGKQFPDIESNGWTLNVNTVLSSIIKFCKEADKCENLDDITKKMEGVFSQLTLLEDFVKEGMQTMRRKATEEDYAGNKVNTLDSAFFKELGWFNNAYERLHMYLTTIKGRFGCMIATISEDEKHVTLNSIDEKDLINNHFNSKYECGLYMSATIGGAYIFADSMGFLDESDIDVKEIGYAEMESTFDFTYSPIFVCGEYNMKMCNREISIPKIAEMINGIMDKWPNNRGCIFVSSYSMVDEFYSLLNENNKRRILLYKNAQEKDMALSVFKNTQNAVIIGPTLFEGISFDDDLCRFSIIAKVPYADTSNKLISWKLKQYGFNEYATSAIRAIIQAVGRGIRHKSDWCNTYILDGGFGDIYRSKGRFPIDFIKRIRMVTSQQLIN